MHSLCVELSGDTKTELLEKLPIDIFLDEFSQRTTAPKIVYQPTERSSQLWTQNLTCFVYAGIEKAFTRAALMSGADLPRYVRELRKLEKWVIKQLEHPDRGVPRHFAV